MYPNSSMYPRISSALTMVVSLDLGVVLVSLVTHLSANTTLLVSSKWNRLVEVGVSVDPHGTGLKSVGNIQSLVDVLGVDTRTKTEVGVVGLLDHLVDGLEWQHNSNRTKDLLLGQLAVLRNVVEHGWLDKVSLVADSVTSGQQLEAGLLSDVDVLENLVELVWGGLGTLVGALLEWVANLELLDSSLELLQETVVPFRVGGLDVDSGTGTAHLSTVEENTGDEVLDGLFLVTVLKHDVWRLSTQFQGDLLDALGTLGHDVLTDTGGSGEGDLLDQWVVQDGVTAASAASWNHVHHTGWNSGLLDKLTSVQVGQWGGGSRLQNNTVTGGKRRTDLPGKHHQWEVPWGDGTANTKRLSLGVGHVAVAGVDQSAVLLLTESSTRSEVVDHNVQIPLGTLQRLTVVQRFDLGKKVSVPLNKVGELPQESGSFCWVDKLPGLESLVSGVDSNINVLGLGLLDVAKEVFGDRRTGKKLACWDPAIRAPGCNGKQTCTPLRGAVLRSLDPLLQITSLDPEQHQATLSAPVELSFPLVPTIPKKEIITLWVIRIFAVPVIHTYLHPASSEASRPRYRPPGTGIAVVGVGAAAQCRRAVPAGSALSSTPSAPPASPAPQSRSCPAVPA
ncbi:hypothetical protein OGAPHI_003100 [Ogataea philodendri]|uniref:Uncharacterized protein n=1 Tax=Ogataea philodendri TaxID=1378263 RepID=A0A9P8P978_9ASCO|nr:uncharacterized protein OGAPHI_003100 [Ogataea philodendri]KAH3667451.1 hypothetical protein OGAPHI_003100 [Ogataea philodendri]